MRKLSKVYMTALALGLSVVLAGPVAWAQSDSGNNGQTTQGDWAKKHGDRQARRERMKEAFAEKLGLTAEQKAQIQQIRANHRPNIEPLVKQLRAERQEIRQSIQGGTFNEALVTQKLTDMAGLKAKLMGERFKIHQEVLSVLTPEQKATLAQMREQFRARHQGHRFHKAG